MTLSKDRNENENKKFVEPITDKTAIVVEQSAAPTVLTRKLETATITFEAATTGTAEAHTIFTVTGVVAVTLFAVVGTDATSGGAATISVGTALSPVALLPSVAYTVLDANEIWHDATPDASVELDSVLTKKIIIKNIIYTIGTTTLTGGTIKFYLSWYPISSDGNVVVA